MKIHFITYKGKPLTMGKFHKSEGKAYGIYGDESERLFAGATKKATISHFLYFAGFTFPEWQRDGYDVATIEV